MSLRNAQVMIKTTELAQTTLVDSNNVNQIVTRNKHKGKIVVKIPTKINHENIFQQKIE